MTTMVKHFIDIDNFDKAELRKILNFAKKIKKNPDKYSSLLQNKSLALMFIKQSMRTRLSFDIGMKKLGGNVIELDPKDIGFGSRESEKDMMQVMSKFLDCLIIRNDDHEQILKLSSINSLPIINGLSNFSHPCQILSDIFTIEEFLGNINDNIICWIGDFNNVLVSLIQAAEIFHFKLNIALPTSILRSKKNYIDKLNLKNSNFFSEVSEASKDVNCIMTDTWFSMGEKKSISKKRDLKKFQVDSKVMKFAKKNAIFMHCLPAHRNEEVTDLVIDSKQSVVLQQAENRMYVQQSILNFLINS